MAVDVRWVSGATVVLQEVWRGRLWSARPMTVVRDDGECVALWCPKGTRWKTATTPPTRPRAPTRAERFVANLTRCDWVLGDFTWGVDALGLMCEGDWHGIGLLWHDEHHGGSKQREHGGWYINLQEPFRRTARGFQTMDLMLDVVVDPARRYRWKDEDELAALVAAGLIDPATAQRVHEEGRRVIARLERREPPFDDSWTAWRPDPSWSVPVLPAGWHHL